MEREILTNLESRTLIFEEGKIIITNPKFIYLVRDGLVKIVTQDEKSKINEQDTKGRIIQTISPLETFEVIDNSQIAVAIKDGTKVSWFDECHINELPLMRGLMNRDLRNQKRIAFEFVEVLRILAVKERALEYLKYLVRNYPGECKNIEIDGRVFFGISTEISVW